MPAADRFRAPSTASPPRSGSVQTIQERTARRGAARGSTGHALQRHLVDVALPVTRMGLHTDLAAARLRVPPLGADLDARERPARRVRGRHRDLARVAVARRTRLLLQRVGAAGADVVAELEDEVAELGARGRRDRADRTVV